MKQNKEKGASLLAQLTPSKQECPSNDIHTNDTPIFKLDQAESNEEKVIELNVKSRQ